MAQFLPYFISWPLFPSFLPRCCNNLRTRWAPIIRRRPGSWNPFQLTAMMSRGSQGRAAADMRKPLCKKKLSPADLSQQRILSDVTRLHLYEVLPLCFSDCADKDNRPDTNPRLLQLHGSARWTTPGYRGLENLRSAEKGVC